MLDDAQLRLLDLHRSRVSDRVAEIALSAADGDPGESPAAAELLGGPPDLLVSLGIWCVFAQAERERAFREALGSGASDPGERNRTGGAGLVPGALLRRLQPRVLPFHDAEAALAIDLAAPWSVDALEFAVAAAEGRIFRAGPAPALRAAALRGLESFARRPLGRSMRVRRLAARLEALAARA